MFLAIPSSAILYKHALINDCVSKTSPGYAHVPVVFLIKEPHGKQQLV
jgi:hypothetical protein